MGRDTREGRVKGTAGKVKGRHVLLEEEDRKREDRVFFVHSSFSGRCRFKVEVHYSNAHYKLTYYFWFGPYSYFMSLYLRSGKENRATKTVRLGRVELRSLDRRRWAFSLFVQLNLVILPNHLHLLHLRLWIFDSLFSIPFVHYFKKNKYMNKINDRYGLTLFWPPLLLQFLFCFLP